jgi:tetratricopeptide (TPR) repeat protein
VLDGGLARARVPKRTALAALGVAGALALAGVAIADPAARWDEFKEPPPTKAERGASGFVVSHLASGGGSGRYQLWESAWAAFRDEPARGIGAGAFEAWWTREGSLYQPVRDAHSLYLETLAELGLLGFVCLLGFMLPPPVAAVRAGTRLGPTGRVALAVLAAAATSAAVDWTWELPAAFVPAVVALGALSVAAGGRSPPASRRPRLLAAAIVLCGLACAAGALLSYTSAAELTSSRAAFRDGDPEGALEDARAARAATPWAAEPRLQLALLEERRDLGAANDNIDEAIERAPDDWRVWLVAARLRTRSGDLAGAVEALSEVRTLNPRAYFLPRTEAAKGP